jgi:hypothetical protein
VGKEWVPLQGFNNGYNSIMAAYPQVIALGHIMGKDDP